MHVLGLTNMRVGELEAPFDAMGDDGTLISINPDEGIRAYASALRLGARHVEERQSDAVLVYNGVGLIGLVGMILSLRYDLPLLLRLNGDVHRQHREKIGRLVRRRKWSSLVVHLAFVALTRLAFRLADGFVPVSASLIDIVHQETNCPTERIVPVPNPVPLDVYRPPRDGSNGRETSEGALLLTVTNLNFRGKYEGVVQLINGLKPVLRRRPDLRYVIAGDGHYYDRLQDYLDERVDEDVRNRISAPGFVEDVTRLYRDADVFVYASHIDGYPNAILEAQATGLPVVTNPAYGIEEQVVDGESGVFFDLSDDDEPASTVAALLDDPAERERLGRNARARTEAENAAEVVGPQLRDAIRNVAGSSDGRDSSVYVQRNLADE